jgi:hypothetical protein
MERLTAIRRTETGDDTNTKALCLEEPGLGIAEA